MQITHCEAANDSLLCVHKFNLVFTFIHIIWYFVSEPFCKNLCKFLERISASILLSCFFSTNQSVSAVNGCCFLWQTDLFIFYTSYFVSTYYSNYRPEKLNISGTRLKSNYFYISMYRAVFQKWQQVTVHSTVKKIEK